MKSLFAFAVCILPATLLAGQAKTKADAPTDVPQKDSIPITVSSKGSEVRTVLMSIFDQEKKQYVIEPNIHFAVFLSLEKTDFHRALDIVCTLTGLQAELRDGIYFVHTARNAVVRPVPRDAETTSSTTPSTPVSGAPVKIVTPESAQKSISVHESPNSRSAKFIPIPVLNAPSTKPAGPSKSAPSGSELSEGTVSASSLQKHVTVRFNKADLRSLLSDLSRQSGVKIVVDDKVPAYKLDAFLINTSLRYALVRITKAAGLKWHLPANHTVLITSGSESTTVALAR